MLKNNNRARAFAVTVTKLPKFQMGAVAGLPLEARYTVKTKTKVKYTPLGLKRQIDGEW